jgi:hypothetical protein
MLSLRESSRTLALAIVAAAAVAASVRPAAAQARPATAPGSASRPIQLDLIGDVRGSRNNFTDIHVEPHYNGVDAWTVLRLSVWLGSSRQFGVFGEVIPVTTSVSEFWWQRHVQFGGGVQWYPFGGGGEEQGPPGSELASKGEWLRPVRLFAEYSGRVNYDRPVDSGPLQKHDMAIGLDYYHDNLGAEGRLKTFGYANLTYRTTNFSLAEYRGLLSTGNLKVGPAFASGSGNTVAVPYAVVDWSWAPAHGDRWYENFARVGGGARVYFWRNRDADPGLGSDFLRRLHLYAEVVYNAAWLGDAAPASVNRSDVRAGIMFATGGIYRDRR